MENKIFLEQMKNYFDSLKYFDIQDNFLILHTDKIYRIPIFHTYLSQLEQNIFLLHPIEIIQIIYLLELFYKTTLSEIEKDFIKNYTNKYLSLSENSTNGNDINQNRLWCLELPINNAYKEEFSEYPCSKLIISLIDKHLEEINSGLGKSPKLVLIKNDNPNFLIEEEYDELKTFEKAGFTTILLILSSIISTCLYIAYFIMGK